MALISWRNAAAVGEGLNAARDARLENAKTQAVIDAENRKAAQYSALQGLGAELATIVSGSFAPTQAAGQQQTPPVQGNVLGGSAPPPTATQAAGAGLVSPGVAQSDPTTAGQQQLANSGVTMRPGINGNEPPVFLNSQGQPIGRSWQEAQAAVNGGQGAVQPQQGGLGSPQPQQGGLVQSDQGVPRNGIEVQDGVPQESGQPVGGLILSNGKRPPNQPMTANNTSPIEWKKMRAERTSRAMATLSKIAAIDPQAAKQMGEFANAQFAAQDKAYLAPVEGSIKAAAAIALQDVNDPNYSKTRAGVRKLIEWNPPVAQFINPDSPTIATDIAMLEGQITGNEDVLKAQLKRGEDEQGFQNDFTLQAQKAADNESLERLEQQGQAAKDSAAQRRAVQTANAEPGSGWRTLEDGRIVNDQGLTFEQFRNPDEAYRELESQIAAGNYNPEILNQRDALDTQISARDNVLSQLNQFVGTINKAEALADETLGRGLVDKAQSYLPGTDEYELNESLYETLRSNLSFEELKKMRKESKTGGALGQVTVRELELLSSTIATLNNGLGRDAMLENLSKIRRTYTRFLLDVAGQDFRDIDGIESSVREIMGSDPSEVSDNLIDEAFYNLRAIDYPKDRYRQLLEDYGLYDDSGYLDDPYFPQRQRVTQ